LDKKKAWAIWPAMHVRGGTQHNCYPPQVSYLKPKLASVAFDFGGSYERPKITTVSKKVGVMVTKVLTFF